MCRVSTKIAFSSLTYLHKIYVKNKLADPKNHKKLYITHILFTVCINNMFSLFYCSYVIRKVER